MQGGTKVTEPSNVCVLDLKALKYCYTRQGQLLLGAPSAPRANSC